MASAASFSPKSTKPYNVRCISLPVRSHPVAMKVEVQLNKLKSWEMSTSSSLNGVKICSGVAGLGELYRCIGELLGLPLTQEALSLHNQHENHWVNEFLDGLLMYLDICGSTRDVVLMMKQSVRELQSAIRRSKGGGGNGGDLNLHNYVNAYILSRKKMKKEITKCFASLKQIHWFPNKTELNDHLNLVIKLLRHATSITASILNSLMQFLSAATLIKPKKPTKWSIVSKLVHKRVSVFEGKWEANEFENVDIALSNITSCKDDETEIKNIEWAQEKLETLDSGIEGFENASECLFRQLIQARVALLNIISK